MKQNLKNAKSTPKPGPSRLDAWRQILALVVTLSAALVFALIVCGRPVQSFQGGDPETTVSSPGSTDAFESPLLIWKYPLGKEALALPSERVPGDLLINGNMDEQGFYWRYPNHWIAGSWFEWFSTAERIPEFDDGHRRNIYHTAPSSQRLQLWGATYAGGLMQSAAVEPCHYYRFRAYGESRPGSDNPPPVPVDSHMKVGIEPYGWMSGRDITKYKPGLEPKDFPNTVVWSPEFTSDFKFTPYEVTVEALAQTITVIMFAYPEVNWDGGVLWNDAIWDSASLVEVPPPSDTLVEGSDLPEPDGFIDNLQVQTFPGMAIVEWDTAVPASSQVFYRVFATTEPISASNKAYLPLVVNGSATPPPLDQYSPVDMTSVYHHRVVLTGLPAKYYLDVVALSRRLDGLACMTSASDRARSSILKDNTLAYLPLTIAGE